MQFRTEVKVDKASFEIEPTDRLLFVGSCFADNLGKRFVENRFQARVNPYGVMYNPVSILHTVEKSRELQTRIAVFTLGTNHVYILKETGDVVDNCMKRPQCLFEEKELSLDECIAFLTKAIEPFEKVIVTVSPIRYAKYGYHGSRLSKATLLLAADRLVRENPMRVSYFPAYEIMNDELRDYRFYKEDMLHPSEQAVEYIWQKFRETYFGENAERFLEEWRPIREAIGHKPFDPNSGATKRFLAQTEEKKKQFEEKYHLC